MGRAQRRSDLSWPRWIRTIITGSKVALAAGPFKHNLTELLRDCEVGAGESAWPPPDRRQDTADPRTAAFVGIRVAGIWALN